MTAGVWCWKIMILPVQRVTICQAANQHKTEANPTLVGNRVAANQSFFNDIEDRIFFFPLAASFNTEKVYKIKMEIDRQRR